MSENDKDPKDLDEKAQKKRKLRRIFGFAAVGALTVGALAMCSSGDDPNGQPVNISYTDLTDKIDACAADDTEQTVTTTTNAETDIVTSILPTIEDASADSAEEKICDLFEIVVEPNPYGAANVKGWTNEGNTQFKTVAPNTQIITQKLDDADIAFDSEFPEEGGGFPWYMLAMIVPAALIVGVIIYSVKKQQQMMGGGGAGGPGGFGKNKAKVLNADDKKATFDDVAGVDEAKEDLQEIVDFLKEPSAYTKLGAKIPKGALLVGPPGTGKTLIARAVAGEAGVPFFTTSGSEFVEMFVGVGASRVRDMFAEAKKQAPCIIFIDEIDAVGRHRGGGQGNSNDEREQTLNQILVEMDGFEGNDGIILLAATNRPDVLDPALLRPGRFDRQVVVPKPDLEGRIKILEVHMRKRSIAPGIDVRNIARGTPGFSGADLENLVNEAALLAARRKLSYAGQKEFNDAKDKIMMGAERKSTVMDADELKMTAYHEAGHAICALETPGSDPIHKATIIPRGQALGMVMQLPEKDRYSMNKEQMLSRLIVMMGGRAAEEIEFGEDYISSGASGDIQQATKLARAMVTQWGFSDRLGYVSYETQQSNYLGAFGQTNSASEKYREIIDEEVKQLIDTAYDKAKELLTEKEKEWKNLANGLLEYETLDGQEIAKVIKGEKLERPEEHLLDAAPPHPQSGIQTPPPNTRVSFNFKPGA